MPIPATAADIITHPPRRAPQIRAQLTSAAIIAGITTHLPLHVHPIHVQPPIPTPATTVGIITHPPRRAPQIHA
jgi:hypothetical protein